MLRDLPGIEPLNAGMLTFKHFVTFCHSQIEKFDFILDNNLVFSEMN